MSTELVQADGVEAVFPGPVQALDRLNFNIPAGQFVAILGPSGCGKSTLLRLIAGLLKPSAGVLAVDGQSPTTARRGAVPMSFVFQDPTLLPWRTVSSNVQLPLELLARPSAARGTTVAEALALVGLSSFSNRYPAQLSGGMRMRVSIARAIVTQPKLLLLDEPFGALDDITRQKLNEELIELWRRTGWTGVFVTHNISEAVFLSQRVLVMSPRPGRIVADLPINFPFPRSPELRATPEFARLTGEVSEHLRRTCA